MISLNSFLLVLSKQAFVTGPLLKRELTYFKGRLTDNSHSFNSTIFSAQMMHQYSRRGEPQVARPLFGNFSFFRQLFGFLATFHNQSNFWKSFCFPHLQEVMKNFNRC